ncbi:hypothetical protein QN277_014123 [Acacia crassicarpa]|uniref:Uncharacterized protein n=1 Tax=Acacia crassicarpa TaxID=499986 RepID=A0AAE1N551_9FABA|nr:hypothetical protein QN277_014123 [Acacia crassicarpa]
MKYGNMILAMIGFSSSLLVCVPIVRRWQKKKMVTEKLRIISEALEVAEERVARYQERHDRILSQISAYYLTNTELLEALQGARASMNQALEFAVCLRRFQLNIIRSFPDALDLHLSPAFNPNSSPRN